MTRFTSARTWRAGLLLVAALAAAASLLVTPAVAAPPQVACEKRTNNSYDKMLECVDADGVLEHLAALQAIADANGGTRAEATPGYDASVEYVLGTLEAAGWNVEAVPFEFRVDFSLTQLTPVIAAYETDAFTGTAGGR